MRIHCPNCEFDICDFCLHYNFNGEWYANGSDGFHGPVYIEEGYCRLTGRYSDPLDVCDNFHCFKARTPIDKENGNEQISSYFRSNENKTG